jgi:hypothetical protein
MAANTQPIFPLTPKVSWGTLTNSNILKDGTGTTVSTIFTAGVDGSRIDQIKIRPLGTNSATVVRFFINNGSTNATATNNSLIHEVTIAATTVSEIAAQTDYNVTITVNTSETIPPIPYLPASYKINATIGTTASAGLQITVHGGDY